MIQTSKSASMAAAAAIVAAVSAVPAAAQEFGSPLHSSAVDWSGAYAGGQVGWGWTSGDGAFAIDGTGYDGDFDGNGGNYGLTVGYLYDLGNVILGGEAQFDWSDTHFEDIDLDGYGEVDDAGRLKDMWRVVGLAGYEVGRALVFGTAGWARASLETDNDLFDGEGWVVGAGVDYMVTDRITVGGQINYHSFDDIGTGAESLDFDTTRFQARLMYRF